MSRALFGYGVFLLLFLTLGMGALPAAAGGADGEANVFIYHRFRRRPLSLDEYRPGCLCPATGMAQAAAPAGACAERSRAAPGRGGGAPPGCVALTVDDAFRSFLEGGMPLLRRYGFPVTLFVNSNAVGAPGYLGWDELRALAAEGVEIGNHSATHDYLLERRKGEGEAAWLERVRKDIARAQKALTEHLGKAPRLFAYPFGEYSPELEQLVRQMGFAGAVAQQSGVVWDGSDRFALPRFPMGGPYATLAGFEEKARMRALPVRILAPTSPVLGPAPTAAPSLRVMIAGSGIDLRQLRCFVQGDNDCRVEAVAGKPGEFLVTAVAPLSGRRNKYTLTAPGKRGGWYWFSQPWFQPRRSGNGG